MYVLIAGAGLVGRGLAQKLSLARHDVVVVDSDRTLCEELAARSGVLVVHGSATSVETLEQAGIEKADVAVGTMREDADNLAFAVLAKSFDVPSVVSRMRNPRYAPAYQKAGVAATIDIVDVFVNQLMLQIEAPHLGPIATFGAGGISIVVDTVPEQAAAAGMSVSQIAADPAFPAECVITGIYRPHEQTFVVPRGGAEIHSGDRVFLVAEGKNLRRASKFLHRKR